MTATSVEQVNGVAATRPERGFDAVALAEADAIRARTAAETEAALLKAQAEADAIRAKAEADAEKQRLANRRQAITLEEKEADHAEKMAESERRRKEAERLARQAEEREAAEREATDRQEAEMAAADEKWRDYAIRFAVVCGIVALPVQISAFWNPDAWWLVAAPVMLEGGSWVVQRGAASAVANRRPLWHYRAIAWLLAVIAAGINLWHGWHAFDPATAVATAFASVAGPGVWDLHEHGRIRKRDGILTRRERKAQEKAAKAEAKQQAADEAQRQAEKAAAERAIEEKRAELSERRAKQFPKVWEHAEKLATDLGELDPNVVWDRAKLDVEGAKPGESAEALRMRNAATARVEAARQSRPVNFVGKTTNAQRAIQTPRSGYRPTPPRRIKGDTPRYDRAAGRAHGDLLRTKNARQKDA